MKPRFRRELVGRPVVDADGVELGEVADTWPLDGGGTPEMMLVKVRSGRFAREKYLPVEGVGVLNEYLFLPFTRYEIDDAPDADDKRWGDPAEIARSHWRFVGD